MTNDSLYDRLELDIKMKRGQAIIREMIILRTAEQIYLEHVMRKLSNILHNEKYGGATKEDIVTSLTLTVNDYNETFDKNIETHR